MSNFIKLSSVVINKLHITQIIKKSNKFIIEMSSIKGRGFIICAWGDIIFDNNIIEICEKKNKPDYEIIKNWINNI